MTAQHILRQPDGTTIDGPRDKEFDYFDFTMKRNVPEGTLALCIADGAERAYKEFKVGQWVDFEPPLGDQQQDAYDAVILGNNTFITGPGGVGKSEVVKRIVRDTRAAGRRIAVTASTGIAGVNIGGYTIHSLLGTGLAGSVMELKAHHSQNQLDKAANRLAEVDIILTDEVSMLTGDYIDMMDWWLRKIAMVLYRHGGVDKPFGGWQIVFVGDFLQLPPVIKARKRVAHRYAFQSPAWAAANLQVHYLRKGYRQSDAEFRKHLMRVRKGNAPQETLDYFNTRLGFKFDEGIKPTRVFPTNAEVDRVNSFELNKCPTPEFNYEAAFDGIPAWIDALKNNCPCEPFLELRVNAEVMFIRNNQKLGYVNGTRGRVVSLTKDQITVQAYSGGLIDVPMVEWEMKNHKGDILSSVRQYPLILGWAATVHRCQGSSLDYMEFDPARVFEKAQAYVALSRVRSMDGLRLTNRIGSETVKASNLCVNYYVDLLEKERADAAAG